MHAAAREEDSSIARRYIFFDGIAGQREPQHATHGLGRANSPTDLLVGGIAHWWSFHCDRGRAIEADRAVSLHLCGHDGGLTHGQRASTVNGSRSEERRVGKEWRSRG